MAKEKKPKVAKKEKKEVAVETKKEKKEKKEFAFTVEIETTGESFKGEGDNLLEIFGSFETPALITTETNIRVTKGGKTIQRDLKVADARRCFAGYETTSLELLAISIAKQLP